MRLRSLMLVSAFSVLLTGCAAYTERQFIPDQRTADGVDTPDAPAGGGGDAGAQAPAGLNFTVAGTLNVSVFGNLLRQILRGLNLVIVGIFVAGAPNRSTDMAPSRFGRNSQFGKRGTISVKKTDAKVRMSF